MTDGLRLAGISFRYGSEGKPVLCEVDLDVRRGEMAALVGGSGSGKSSLLRVVSGLEQPSSGEILFGGTSLLRLPPSERSVGMVFQDYALYPHLTVRENLEFPLRARRLAAGEIAPVVLDVARRLRLEEYLHRKPAALSGGQRQRVALGRMLVRSPSIALFDEPLSNLDTVLKREIRVEIRRLHDARGWTSLYVTHDAAEAAALADRIAVIDSGRVVQFDAPATLRENPAHRTVIELLASNTFNLAPPDALPPGWLPDGEGDSQAALQVRTLEAIDAPGAGIPATFLGKSDTDSELAIVQMPWGGHWLVLQRCEAAMGAPVNVVRQQADDWLLFDPSTGQRKFR